MDRQTDRQTDRRIDETEALSLGDALIHRTTSQTAAVADDAACDGNEIERT